MRDEADVGVNQTTLKRFIVRVKITLFSVVILGCVLISSMIFLPMKIELEKSLTDNFNQVAQANYNTLTGSIQRSVEGGASLSSRTMIKNAIIDYMDGAIGLEQLREYTQPKYEDGTTALEFLLVAQRYVGNELIASYMAEEDETLGNLYFSQTQEFDVKLTLIIVQENQLLAVVISPITDKNSVLGYDKLIFDLSSQVETQCGDNIKMSFYSEESYQTIVNNAVLQQDSAGLPVYREGDMLFNMIYLQDGCYVSFSIAKKVLFETVNKLTLTISIVSVIFFFVIIFLVYHFIIRFAKNNLSILELSRDQFKNIAYKDGLTGVYTRQYMDVWQSYERIANQDYCIVLIDVDQFKSINDTYGHAVGDEVLKAISKTISSSIKKSDRIFRYGGDEFVFILSDIKKEDVQSIVERINEKLAQLDQFPSPISISYGISQLVGRDDFYKKLREADELMYQYKQRDRNGSESVCS